MKLLLNVELLQDKSVKIIIRYIHPSISIVKNTHIDTCFKYKDITIWTCGKFVFDEKQIRLPELSKVINNSEIYYIYEFKTEKDRYETLKKYYMGLCNWSNSNKIFNEENTKTERTDYKITNSKNYWYIF